jgi:hypothetical protein
MDRLTMKPFVYSPFVFSPGNLSYSDIHNEEQRKVENILWKHQFYDGIVAALHKFDHTLNLSDLFQFKYPDLLSRSQHLYKHFKHQHQELYLVYKYSSFKNVLHEFVNVTDEYHLWKLPLQIKTESASVRFHPDYNDGDSEM